MLVDDFLQTYDVSDAVATVVHADLATTWDALMEVDLIALGLVGRFWRPVIEFASVAAEQFRDFAEPGYAKTIYALSVRSIGERRTLLTGVMRTATTDEHARRWFRRYWTFGIGSGAHILVNGLIDVTREMAEARAGVSGS
jgi:hypothetical protein